MAELRRAPDTAFFADRSLAALYGAACVFERVATDSRDAGSGALFVCLAGERTDGHRYIPQVLESGCRAFLVAAGYWASGESAALRKAVDTGTVSVVVADDTLRALQLGAAAWRRHCEELAGSEGRSVVKIGITGSSGKTTAKELIAAVMLAWRPGVKNPGNLNSDIGLAASLFLLRPEHQVAVFEMGINKPGEMAVLAELFEPDCAVITNIGTAHIGVLGGTRQAIAAEKKRICSRFNGSQVLVYPEQDDFAEFLVREVAGRCVAFGPRSLAKFEGARSLGVQGWDISYAGLSIQLQLGGAHNVSNALAALAVAELYGVPAGIACRALSSVSAMSGRSQIFERNGMTVINDSYNANPDSMRSAIAMAEGLLDLPANSGRRLVFVLGSMKELGAYSDSAHRELGLAAARSRASVVAFFGDEARQAWQSALEQSQLAAADACSGEHGAKCYLFNTDFDEFAAQVLAELAAGDILLVKGSRGVALERLLERLQGGEVSHVS